MTRAAAVLFAALLAGACASVPRDAGLAEVRQSAQQRTPITGDVTADQAVAIAMQNSPRLQARLAELGVARADLIEASTIANPLLEVELRYPASPYRPYEIRVAQTLLDLIQLPRRRAFGRAAFAAAKLSATREILRFAADVRDAYFDVVAATQHVALSRTITESARAAAELALRQHDAENITDLELENEQANYEQAKLEQARAERDLVVAREALARMMGAKDDAFAVAASFIDLPAKEADALTAPRVDVTLAERELDIARRRVPLARLAVLDAVELDVHYEREPEGTHTVGPGIQLPIPIFNTGRAARTRAEAEMLRARFTLEALRAEAPSRIRAAEATLGEARARVEYYRDVVLPRRARIVSLTQLEHNAMLVGVYQLLDAKRGEVEAQRAFIDAQRDYWRARNDLDRAVQGIAKGNE